jgi:putative endopeptidase
VLNAASYFGEPFLEAAQTYQEQAYGVTGSTPLETLATWEVSSLLPDEVGMVYAKRYCSDETVQEVTQMIQQIIGVFRQRISDLDWMSEETKEKALLKLDTMRIHVGAPEEFYYLLDGYALKSTQEGGSYFQNVMEMTEISWAMEGLADGETVDKDQWITNPQTVNAFYAAPFNSINFPAAVLQDPVYNPDASYEENLGALGTVIAHEVTHAFDQIGSQYDENGNTENWWSKMDSIAFDVLCIKAIRYFDGQEAAPGVVIDPYYTLSENIADLGAIACVSQLGSQIEGFDFKKMYESYARLWWTSTTREYAQYLAYVDTHSPGVVRVNRVLQSVDQFYETYDIGPGDGMYVPPEDRLQIW